MPKSDDLARARAPHRLAQTKTEGVLDMTQTNASNAANPPGREWPSGAGPRSVARPRVLALAGFAIGLVLATASTRALLD